MAFRKRKADELNAAKTSRMKGTTIERTIVFGNVSWWLGKDADEAHTHRWVTFVRGPNNEDISYFIKKVVFTLHPSFQNPVRGVFWLSDRWRILTYLTTLAIEKPPFEVAETGWGEFEIAIKIHFVDPSERTVDLFHGLVLYPSEGQSAATTKKPVVREVVEPLVFTDPTEYFYSLLKSHEAPPKAKTLLPHPASENIFAIVPTTPAPAGSSPQLIGAFIPHS